MEGLQEWQQAQIVSWGAAAALIDAGTATACALCIAEQHCSTAAQPCLLA